MPLFLALLWLLAHLGHGDLPEFPDDLFLSQKNYRNGVNAADNGAGRLFAELFLLSFEVGLDQFVGGLALVAGQE
jgi:hypothetical protein